MDRTGVLVAVLGIAGAVGAVYATRKDPRTAERDAKALAIERQSCAEREWDLVAPSGETERVPQDYVNSAIAKRGYRLPDRAERVFVHDSYSTDEDDPCHGRWVIPRDSAESALASERYKFRGYRSATAEERLEDERRQKFGAPEH